MCYSICPAAALLPSGNIWRVGSCKSVHWNASAVWKHHFNKTCTVRACTHTRTNKHTLPLPRGLPVVIFSHPSDHERFELQRGIFLMAPEPFCSKQPGDCGDFLLIEVALIWNDSDRITKPADSNQHKRRFPDLWDAADTRTTYLWFSSSPQIFQHVFCLSSSSELRVGDSPVGTRPVEDEAGRHVVGCSGPDLAPGPGPNSPHQWCENVYSGTRMGQADESFRFTGKTTPPSCSGILWSWDRTRHGVLRSVWFSLGEQPIEPVKAQTSQFSNLCFWHSNLLIILFEAQNERRGPFCPEPPASWKLVHKRDQIEGVTEPLACHFLRFEGRFETFDGTFRPGRVHIQVWLQKYFICGYLLFLWL